MGSKRAPWQMQALAAHKRDLELQKVEQQQKLAQYFEKNTRTNRHHEQWTTDGYYEKANREAELLSERKIKAVKLEERRKKLELMLFQEKMAYQQEMKTLSAQPKLYKNGSYLNDVPTSTLRDINQGIKDKEEQLQRHEAELRLHHAWRARQPELRAAESYMRTGKLKSAWMEQIVQQEVQKKKEREETQRSLLERDESIRRQIEMEEQRARDKALKIKELRSGLESQISELSEKEKAVKLLRTQEEKERHILEELKFIRLARESEHRRLTEERNTNIVNMGLHKYNLKRKILGVVKEIDLELDMLNRLKDAVLKDFKDQEMKSVYCKRILDAAYHEMMEIKKVEKQRMINIETLYDGEARQIAEKQDEKWAKEREARATLMEEVLATLQEQINDKLEANRRAQKENVLDRERILDQVDDYHKEVRSREKEREFQNTSYGTMTNLQTQLNSLKLEKQKLEDGVARENSVREAIAHEERLRKELVSIHRDGVSDLPARRKVAWY